MKFRRTVYKLHKWTGLGVGVLLLLQAFTGLALVFRAPAEEFLLKQVIGKRASIGVPDVDNALLEARQAYPGYALERLVMPTPARSAMVLRLMNRQTNAPLEIAADPDTGKVLAQLDGWSGLPYSVFRLHKELFLGQTGHLIVLTEGVLLAGFLISGFYLWWPGRKRQALKIHWKGPKARRRYDLHRVTGVLILPTLSIVVVAGVVMTANIWLSGGKLITYADGSADPAPLNPVIQQILETEGAGAIKDIRFSADGETATILLHASQAALPGAVNRLAVARDSGNILSRRGYDEGRFWQRVYSWVYPTHTGQIYGGGVITRVVMSLTAAGLLVLGIFGFLLWISRKKRKTT